MRRAPSRCGSDRVRSLYEKTIAFILQLIDERQLREGAQLPPEAKLALEAGVSLVTVRRALAELATQGIVRREQGRGTFVSRPRVRAETTRMGSLRNGLHLDARSKLKTRVLGCSVRGASAEESEALGLAAGASVWELVRLRLLNGRPLILEVSAIPKLLAPDLGTHFDADPARSLYDLLESSYGLKEAREEQLLANILDRPVRPYPDVSPAALGAALGALAAIGHRAPAPPAAGAATHPDDSQPRYEALYARYLGVSAGCA